MKTNYRIAILGGGPSGLFAYKRMLESGRTDLEITIFEKKHQLGAGMPYSREGANEEHITNVSGNEIPPLATSVDEWIQTVPETVLQHFNISKNHFNDYKVLPRLLFGEYLSAQFDLLQQRAKTSGIATILHLNKVVTDVIDKPELNQTWVETDHLQITKFDCVVICIGHRWPKNLEGKIPGYFDSPYPPSKLSSHFNHRIAIKGSSLTAIDAIRTLARNNGTFSKDAAGKLIYSRFPESPDFKMVMHSRSGLLPAVRFHLEDSHLQNDSLLTEDEIAAHRSKNNGFLSLDFVFDKDFKQAFILKDPEFYARIKDMRIEEFVDSMMELRERLDPFVLLKAEYAEAEKSIRRHQSVYWKEMLAVLSFAMNYPAKYLSAEDMIRLQKVLMPLISIVIAFVPQASASEMLVLHECGVLEIVSVGADSSIDARQAGGIDYNYTDEAGNAHSHFYKTFVDCVGQPHLNVEDFPFKSMKASKIISQATLQFQKNDHGALEKKSGNAKVQTDQHGNFFLDVPGIAINDNFQVIDQYGAFNNRIYIMAVPYIGGYNPDYSGLDFCEAASLKISKSILEQNPGS